MHYQVLQRIEAVKTGQSTTLELGGFDLTELPDEVYSLTQLKILRVRNLLLASNQSFIDYLKKHPKKDDQWLADLEEAEQELKNDLVIPRHLQRIDARIGRLQSLVEIDLSYNHLETLPEELGNLPNLRVVVLNNNHLTELPESLQRLSTLHGLDVRENPLLSLPQFPQLKKYEVYRAHFGAQKNEAVRSRDYKLAGGLREKELSYGLSS